MPSSTYLSSSRSRKTLPPAVAAVSSVAMTVMMTMMISLLQCSITTRSSILVSSFSGHSTPNVVVTKGTTNALSTLSVQSHNGSLLSRSQQWPQSHLSRSFPPSFPLFPRDSAVVSSLQSSSPRRRSIRLYGSTSHSVSQQQLFERRRRRRRNIPRGRRIRRKIMETFLQKKSNLQLFRRRLLMGGKQKVRSLLVSMTFAFCVFARGAGAGTGAGAGSSFQRLEAQPSTTITRTTGRSSPTTEVKESSVQWFARNKNSNRNNNNKNARVLATTTTARSSSANKAARSKQAKQVKDAATGTLRSVWADLSKEMVGPRSDTLLLLLSTALITPLCRLVNTSPILGYLAAGMLLGPNGWGLISGIHTTETLAELGIVFFLFEMGIELSVERLMSMKKDVFGLGLSQFACTAAVVAGIAALTTDLSGAALVVLGGALALSSSAFVLQILKEKDQLATRFGRASFGVLLFQDLAVVPLLVVTPILAGNGVGLAAALGEAGLKATLALSSIAFLGHVVMNPLFKLVAAANSQEAFLGVVLLTVLSLSFLTEGLGLSNTLGAFLAGVLLSETKYRYQVEADIAPFRGVLLGLFFVTVGFEIDVSLIRNNAATIGTIVAGIVGTKAILVTALSLAFRLSLANAQQVGLLLSQGGEFAFVTFGLARGLGIIDPYTTKVLLTSISLTMAATPALTALGSRIAKQLEENSDFTHYLGQDREASELTKENEDFVVVIGYGQVGKVVCDLLDRKFVKYVGLEIDPNKAIQARNKGLPIFYGDIAGNPQVAQAFNVGAARAVVVTVAEQSNINRCVVRLRRNFPDLPIFTRATSPEHASRLQNTLDVAAMVPILPEDNVLLTLPFGGAVLKALGAGPPEEINAILEAKRKEVLSGRGLDENEEEAVLLQLGIKTASSLSTDKDTSNNNNNNDDRANANTALSVSHGANTTVAVTTPSPPATLVEQVIEANLVTNSNANTNNNNSNNKGAETTTNIEEAETVTP